MSRDPFDILAGMAPRHDEYLAPGDEPEADALLERLVAHEPAQAEPEVSLGEVRPFRSRRRVVALAVAASVVIAAGGTVAAVVLLRRPADPTQLVCYSEAAREPKAKVGLTIDPQATSVQQCAELWTNGTLGTQGAKGLVACVADFDVTVVVPNATETTCQALGWQPANLPAPGDQLDQQVAAAVPGLFGECLGDLTVAKDRVAALLKDLGADNSWTVVVDGATSTDRPCAGDIVDATTRTIRIIAFQPPGG